MNIWIKNATILTMDDSRLVMEGVNLYIKGKEIYRLGEELEGFEADKVIDARGKLVMPGLINAHTHIAMSIFRNYGNDVSLESWLNDYIWPAESGLKAEDVRIGSLLSIAEMIETGTTTFVDMYYFMDEVAKASKEMGIRAVLTRGMTNPTREILEGEKDFYKKWHMTEDGRLMMMLAAHAVYTNDRDHLLEIGKLCDKLDLGLHIHLNESQTEVQNSLKDNGMPPLEYADSLGLLNSKTLAAHCVWLTDKERQIAHDRGVNMVHNPSSNMKLASGFMRVQELLDQGINVCLGTDGPASNNTLDMFDEMRLASLIAKGYNLDPENLSALTVLKMATINGAKAIGLGDRLGKIKEGYLADLILVDFDNIRHIPSNDLIASLVYSTNGLDVDTTIVNGEIIYENKKHLNIDIDQLKKDIARSAERLIK